MECCSICYDPLNGDKVSAFLNDEAPNDAVVEVGNNVIALDERWDGCLANPKLQFCNECIFQYLQASIFESKLNDKGRVACPCPEKCGGCFSDEEVHRYITNTFDYQKYLLFSKRKQVESDPNCIFCPNVNCGNPSKGGTVIYLDQSQSLLQLKCKECKVSVCSKCHSTHSVFVSCERAMGSSFNAWKHTTPSGCKPCPSCHFYIEKNEGCNHMTCSRCTHQFCWLCLSAWNGGCSSPKICKFIAVWDADVWGSGPIQRGFTRSFALVAAAPAAGLAVGLAATGVGCVAAAGAVAVPAVTVIAIGRTIQQGIYIIKRQTYPIIVHLPWNRRVPWCESTDGDTEAGSFLGFEGRHHPCGIFVSKVKISSEALGTTGWKSWLKHGPYRLQGNVTLVVYFVPNGTTRVTLRKMLPEYDTYPTTAYPGSSYSVPPSQYDSARSRFQSRVLTAIEDFISRGGSVSVPGNNHSGLISDPEDYGLPEPADDHLNECVFNSDIMRCQHCLQPKYFTNSLLFQTHLANEHPSSVEVNLIPSNVDIAVLG